MKKIKKALRLLLLLVFLFSLTTPALAADPAARVISILRTEGEKVTMTKGTARQFTAREGTKLFDGYTVTTGADSYGYLKMDEDSLLKVNEKSEIGVSKLSPDKLSIAVKSGGIAVNAARQKPGDTLEVRAGNAALAIRGTIFTAEYIETDEFESDEFEFVFVIIMLEGEGSVDGRLLKAGQTMYVYDKTINRIHEIRETHISGGMSKLTLETIWEYQAAIIAAGTFTEEEIAVIPALIEEKIQQQQQAPAEIIPADDIHYYEEEPVEAIAIAGGGGGGGGTSSAVSVVWNAVGGTPAPTQTSVVSGGTITAPPAPNRNGFDFGGWYTDPGHTMPAYFPMTNVNAPQTFYAQWLPSSTTIISPFNDPNFEAAVRTLIGKATGDIFVTDVSGITILNVYGQSISDLSEIEYFIALEHLTCDYNLLTTLDITKNTALKSLVCSSNLLTTLDVSGCPELEWLICYSINISTLDISNNPALNILDCNYNQLTALDTSNNPDLEELICEDNLLTSLDLTNNTALVRLACEDNLLTSLDLTNNTVLVELRCANNQLATLDVTNNLALENLMCGDNQLTSMDVTNNLALEYLLCYNNQLTSMDVTNNLALEVLDCEDNQLTSMDVTNNLALRSFYCGNNQLITLDVTNNAALTHLSCTGNGMTQFDVIGWSTIPGLILGSTFFV